MRRRTLSPGSIRIDEIPSPPLRASRLRSPDSGEHVHGGAAEPQESLADLIWLYTHGSNDESDAADLATMIDSQASSYPLLPSKSETTPVNKRALLLGLKPFLQAMDLEKRQESRAVESATNAKPKRDKDTGLHYYEDELNATVAPALYASLYSRFVEARRIERWGGNPLIEPTRGPSAELDVPRSRAATRLRKTMSPSQMKLLAASESQTVDVRPNEADAFSSRVATRLRKTMSPSQFNLIAVNSSDAQTFKPSPGPSPPTNVDAGGAAEIEARYVAEMEAIEACLFEEWATALER